VRVVLYWCVNTVVRFASDSIVWWLWVFMVFFLVVLKEGVDLLVRGFFELVHDV